MTPHRDGLPDRLNHRHKNALANFHFFHGLRQIKEMLFTNGKQAARHRHIIFNFKRHISRIIRDGTRISRFKFNESDLRKLAFQKTVRQTAQASQPHILNSYLSEPVARFSPKGQQWPHRLMALAKYDFTWMRTSRSDFRSNPGVIA